MRPCRLTEGRNIVFDGDGQHAWMVADTLLDVLIDLARSAKAVPISVTGVVAPKELGILVALGPEV